MALPVAQLGYMPQINLPNYVPAPQQQLSVWDKALAAFLTGAASQAAGGLVSNVTAKDYAPKGEQTGFWKKVLEGPAVTREQYEVRESDKRRSTEAEKGRTHQTELTKTQLDSTQKLQQEKLDADYWRMVTQLETEGERELARQIAEDTRLMRSIQASKENAEAGRRHDIALRTAENLFQSTMPYIQVDAASLRKVTPLEQANIDKLTAEANRDRATTAIINGMVEEGRNPTTPNKPKPGIPAPTKSESRPAVQSRPFFLPNPDNSLPVPQPPRPSNPTPRYIPPNPELVMPTVYPNGEVIIKPTPSWEPPSASSVPSNGNIVVTPEMLDKALRLINLR